MYKGGLKSFWNVLEVELVELFLFFDIISLSCNKSTDVSVFRLIYFFKCSITSVPCTTSCILLSIVTRARSGYFQQCSGRFHAKIKFHFLSLVIMSFYIQQCLLRMYVLCIVDITQFFPLLVYTRLYVLSGVMFVPLCL